MTVGRFFLSYSSVDGAGFALRLADALEAGTPSFQVWLDKRDLRPGRDWDEQIVEALRTCRGLLFVMTADSVTAESGCKQEWSRAMKYKKPIIPLRLEADAEMPFRLGSRQYIDFRDFTPAVAQLRRHLMWMSTQEATLSEMRLNLAEARRALPRTVEDRRPVVEAEIQELLIGINQLQLLISDPIAELERSHDRRAVTLDMRQHRHASNQSVSNTDKDISSSMPTDRSHRPPTHESSSVSAYYLDEDQLETFGLPNRIGIDTHSIGAEMVAGSIALDSSICDYGGVDLSDVVINEVGMLEDFISHPSYILEDLRTSIAPVPNRPKAHLIEWHAPIIDQGDILTLDLARSDYWTSEATRRTIARVQSDVMHGLIDLMRMPRRLDVHLVVITEGDNMLLLTRRGRHVATEPSTWMVSVGESMDWELDKNTSGVSHPAVTARRCLSDRDELNLPQEVAESARFRLVAIATEWSEMLANLIVVARLPKVTYASVRHHFRKGENLQLDAIDFDLESCARLLRSTSFAGSNSRDAELPLSDISRLALIAALRTTYPLPDIVLSAS